MKKYVISVLVTLVVMVFAVNAHALIIDPGDYGFGPDDGSELFNHCNCMTSWEGYDIDSKGGTTFGFFFSNDPGTLITIFDPTDDGTLQNPPKAKVDFLNGIVYDVDALSIQDTFMPQNNSIPIGFFLIPDAIHTLYTVESMNTLGDGDLAQTYRHNTINDKYLIRFENPLSQNMTLAYEVVKGITPVQVSEPATLTLVGLGILLVGLFSIRSLIYKKGSVTN